MLSPGRRDTHRQGRRIRHRHEDTKFEKRFAWCFLARMHASDQPRVDGSFSSDGEEISEIHWICDDSVPDPEIHSITWLV